MVLQMLEAELEQELVVAVEKALLVVTHPLTRAETVEQD
jgi:hypothetical protein